REVLGLDQCKAIHNILGFGVGTVMNGFLLTPHHLAGAFQRMAGIFDMALFAQLPEPSHPFLQVFLHLLWRRGRVSATKQKCKFTHGFSPSLGMTPNNARKERQRTYFFQPSVGYCLPIPSAAMKSSALAIPCAFRPDRSWGRANTNAKARHIVIAMGKANGIKRKYIHTTIALPAKARKNTADNRPELRSEIATTHCRRLAQ